ncbi:MAG: DUF1192 domain-containing protein [Alphaproteobacteria bacterium]
MEDEELTKAESFEIGEDLDAISVVELRARIATLETEIDRMKAAIDAKTDQRAAANALFS